VEAALEACRRGVLVEIYADLGFNDEVSAPMNLSSLPTELVGLMGMNADLRTGRIITLSRGYEPNGRYVHVFPTF
jgi:hypothetical protein